MYKKVTENRDIDECSLGTERVLILMIATSVPVKIDTLHGDETSCTTKIVSLICKPFCLLTPFIHILWPTPGQGGGRSWYSQISSCSFLSSTYHPFLCAG